MLSLLTIPDEKRPVRRDIFEFPHICEPAIKHDARYLAIYHGLRQGWSFYALAKRWGEYRITIWRQWERALLIIRDALVREMDEAAYDEGDMIEFHAKAWKGSVGVMRKESGHWKWVGDWTLRRAIERIEGDAEADEE